MGKDRFNRKIAKNNPEYWRNMQRMQGSTMDEYETPEEEQGQSLWSKATTAGKNALSGLGGGNQYEPGSDEELLNVLEENTDTAFVVENIRIMMGILEDDSEIDDIEEELKFQDTLLF